MIIGNGVAHHRRAVCAVVHCAYCAKIAIVQHAADDAVCPCRHRKGREVVCESIWGAGRGCNRKRVHKCRLCSALVQSRIRYQQVARIGICVLLLYVRNKVLWIILFNE